jgi:hypothetical protein
MDPDLCRLCSHLALLGLGLVKLRREGAAGSIKIVSKRAQTLLLKINLLHRAYTDAKVKPADSKRESM